MNFDVPDYMVWQVWTFLCKAPPVFRHSANTVRRHESRDLLEEFMEDMCVSFVPDISDVLQSARPPSIDYFKNLLTTISKSWAVYGLVLEKVDCRPRVYVSSGTHSGVGVEFRFGNYDEGISLPSLVHESLAEGYIITHKCVLCWAPCPRPELRFQLRDLFLTLETIFSIIFGAMNPIARIDRLPKICPWPAESFEYDGLCTHAAYSESLRLGSAHGLAPDELEAHFERIAEEKRENQRRRYAEVIESRWFSCDICDVTYERQSHLDAHFATQGHIDRVNGVERSLKKQGLWKLANRTSNRYYDDICGLSFGSKADMRQHLGSNKHKTMAAEAGRPVVGDQDVDDLDFVDSPGDDLHVDDLDMVDVQDGPGPAPDFRSDPRFQAANEVDRQETAKWRADNIAAKKYHCHVCDRSYPTSTILNLHQNTAIHRKNAKAAAEQGDAYVPPTPKPATQWGPYKARQRAAHKAAKTHYCPTCDKAFGDAAVLQKHLKTAAHLKKLSKATPVDKA
jgi:hypothetical protein